jgi:nucleoid-associated protein YgaU
MNGTIRQGGVMILCCVAGIAAAQPPASPSAQSEAGEPRANTSEAAPQPPAQAAPQAPPQAASQAPAKPAAKPAANSPAAQKAAKSDRLELGTATVTGDREQPKVMYIVPWKKSDIGDLAGKPMNSLVDEILAPVDRDVFKREVVYYGALQGEMSQNGALPKPAPQGEK